MSEGGQLKTCRFQLVRLVTVNKILCEALNLACDHLELALSAHGTLGSEEWKTDAAREALKKIKELKEKLP